MGAQPATFINCAPLARPQELCHWLRGVFERARAEGVPSTVTPGEGEGLRAVAYELWQAGLRTRHALARAPPEALERGQRIEPRRGAFRFWREGAGDDVTGGGASNDVEEG